MVIAITETYMIFYYVVSGHSSHRDIYDPLLVSGHNSQGDLHGPLPVKVVTGAYETLPYIFNFVMHISH